MLSFSFYRLSIAAHLIHDHSFTFTSPLSSPTLCPFLSRPLTPPLSHLSSPDSVASSFKSFPLRFLAFLSPLCVRTLLSLIFSSCFSTPLFPLFLLFLFFLFLLHLLLLLLPQSLPIDLLLFTNSLLLLSLLPLLLLYSLHPKPYKTKTATP